MNEVHDCPNGARNAIDIENVLKHYGRAVALRDFSCSVEAGSAVALWGPNGAGKTTLIRCVLGLARYSGRIMIRGEDARKSGKSVRAQIGYVPQELPIFPFTVGEAARFVAKLKHASLDNAQRQLDLLGLGDLLDREIRNVSGGMRQRLSLALALIGAPSILLLDEPTANLDARGRAELLDLLRTLQRDGMTLVFSSHRQDDILAIADRVLMIERGRLRASLTPEEFLAEVNRAQRLIVTLSNGHLPEAMVALRELGIPASATGSVLTIPVTTRQKAEVLTRLARHGVDIDDFEMEQMEWNDH